MAALSLHHAIFTDTNEKDSDLSMHSATPFLRPVPDRDVTPTSQLFASTVYQDIIQRQPTHPDGPTLGWDLGLHLLGDPITAAEHKSSEGHQIKIRLRRLHATNIVLELLFGMWGTYTSVRYCVAFAYSAGTTEDVYSLALGILSALAVALVICSILMPLFPRQGHSRAWRYTRTIVRACYLLLLSTAAVTNLVLVVLWHPSQFCRWDLDVLWHTSVTNTDTTPCHPAPFAAWIAVAIVRLVVTSTVALLFVYTLRSYDFTRHPISNRRTSKYSSCFASDPEDVSPMSTSSPHHLSRSTHEFTQWGGSSHTLNRSNTTLPKYNSISTLAPSTSCTGHSRPHSTPPCKDVPPPRISPPTSRSTSGHVSNHTTRLGSDSQSLAQSVTDPSSAPHMLRRTSRVSVTRVTSDTTLSDVALHAGKLSGQTIARDPSEIRSWKPGHRGIPVHVDSKKTTAALAWESHVRQASHASTGSTTLSSTAHEDGESTQEKGREDDGRACAYGYGASGPTYPYLDMYHPQRPKGDDEVSSSSCEDLDAYGPSQGHRRPLLPFGPIYPDVLSASSCSSSRSEVPEEDYESTSSEAEEAYVAMMGGFVRRMSTIESLGSKEAAGTLSTATCSAARHRDPSPSPFSDRFSACCGTSASASTAPSSNGHPSLGSTLYFSLSSGGTGTTGAGAGTYGMRVNERGELVPGPSRSDDASGSAVSSLDDRRYFTASGRCFERATEDEDRGLMANTGDGYR